MNKSLYIQVFSIIKELNLDIYPYDIGMRLKDNSLSFDIYIESDAITKRKYLPIIIVNNEIIYITIDDDDYYGDSETKTETEDKSETETSYYVKHPHDPHLYQAIAFSPNQLDIFKIYLQAFFRKTEVETKVETETEDKAETQTSQIIETT